MRWLHRDDRFVPTAEVRRISQSLPQTGHAAWPEAPLSGIPTAAPGANPLSRPSLQASSVMETACHRDAHHYQADDSQFAVFRCHAPKNSQQADNCKHCHSAIKSFADQRATAQLPCRAKTRDRAAANVQAECRRLRRSPSPRPR